MTQQVAVRQHKDYPFRMFTEEYVSFEQVLRDIRLAYEDAVGESESIPLLDTIFRFVEPMSFDLIVERALVKNDIANGSSLVGDELMEVMHDEEEYEKLYVSMAEMHGYSGGLMPGTQLAEDLIGDIKIALKEMNLVYLESDNMMTEYELYELSQTSQDNVYATQVSVRNDCTAEVW